MPRFFIRQDQIEGDTLRITGEDAHHISRSLRMAAGEMITVCDMQGREYECALSEFLEGEVRARILSSKASENEPPVFIRLFQALPKGDKLDYIIQKSVELGVHSVVPVNMKRSVAKASKEDSRLIRRQHPSSPTSVQR